MAENSGIAWTTHTFNPWVGCTKVGPGCDHCYAEAWNACAALRSGVGAQARNRIGETLAGIIVQAVQTARGTVRP